jgi:protocatechuate 3,4-dioxygenase beta subunit
MRVILTSLLISCSLFAQHSGDLSIKGLVVNAQTGEPVKYALVSLTAVNEAGGSDSPQMPSSKSVQTNGSGEFEFAGLAKGHYMVNAQKPGFSSAFSAKHPNFQNVELNQSTSGIQIQLSPLGVIEGRVLDENDEPLLGVTILALQVQIQDGYRQTHAARTVSTDDRGAYRLWNLEPGDYYIKASGRSGGTTKYVGDGSPSYTFWQSFAPAFFGGGQTLDSATPIKIEAGSKFTADLRLRLTPSFKIHGTLASPPSGTVTFGLLRGPGDDSSPSRASLNSTNGRFEVEDVIPGSYILRVTQDQKMRGEATIQVGDSDVNGVSVILAPAVTIHGVTRRVGPALKMRDMPGVDRLVDQAQSSLGGNFDDTWLNREIEPVCNLSLHGDGKTLAAQPLPRRGAGQSADGDGEGAFTIRDVLPGVYLVAVRCFTGYATSVLAGGVDLLANPTLVIQPGVTPAPIEIQARAGGGMLTGEVTVDPISDSAGLLLVPASTALGGPIMNPIARIPGQRKFSQQFVPPGDYAVYLFSNWLGVEYRNPAFLQTLSGGVSVHIEDGKQADITIEAMVK